MPDEQDATAPASSPPITPIAPRRDIETVANRWVNWSKRSSSRPHVPSVRFPLPRSGTRRVRAIEPHDQRMSGYRPFISPR
jgi:hypothetical protein